MLLHRGSVIVALLLVQICPPPAAAQLNPCQLACQCCNFSGISLCCLPCRICNIFGASDVSEVQMMQMMQMFRGMRPAPGSSIMASGGMMGEGESELADRGGKGGGEGDLKSLMDGLMGGQMKCSCKAK